MSRYDVAIVGAGIAGASLAAEIAGDARVLLLEAEDAPGYHATGRSAAFWSETYGGPGVQPLTTASGDWLSNPPADYGGESFLSPRGELFIATDVDAGVLDTFERAFAGTGVPLERVDPAAMVAGLRSEWTQALFERTCQDIDVARLHAAFLKHARHQGAGLVTSAALTSACRDGNAWAIETTAGAFQADVLVDAAGAWADPVAALAGIAPLGIQPYRRTMVQLRTDPPAPATMPLVRDARDRFYFKPEAGGRIWLSPHDEIPSDPCDAAPEELDVALAVDRLQSAVDWSITVERKWAGLRSFAPDRLPVYGYDPTAPRFFWFAGQGGFGIQTSPAAAKLAAALLLRRAPDPMIAHLDAGIYSPARFRA